MNKQQIQYPLCVATNQPTPNAFTEKYLESSMSGEDIVRLKCELGIKPTRGDFRRRRKEKHDAIEYKLVHNIPLTYQECIDYAGNMSLPNEIWKDIPGFEGLYQISNYYRVRSYDRVIKDKTGTRKLKGRMLTPYRYNTSISMTLCKDGVHYNSNIKFIAEDLFDKNELLRIVDPYQVELEEKVKNGINLTFEEIAAYASLESLPGEEWKPVVGFEGEYEVSNMGRVKSFPKKQTPGSGCVFYTKTRILSPSLNGDKYYAVALSLSNANPPKSRAITVHRLVAQAFIPNDDPENKTEVNHIDGNHFNNFVSNLEWLTPIRNKQYSAEMSFLPHKLTHDLLAIAVKYYEQGYETREIVNMPEFKDIGIDHDSLGEAIFRRSYKWCTDIPIPKHHRRHTRRVVGSMCSWAKFTPKQILEIRSRYQRGMSIYRIGKLLGASNSSIYEICRNLSYTDVTVEKYPNEAKEVQAMLDAEMGDQSSILCS